ncbi:MAG TPA: arginase [Gemmatimonadales bacterium]|nr:arginase [Gemmatimonadales bacterium]
MNIELLGVPMDLGSGRRGVDMGPSALRIAGVASALAARGHRVVDGGDLDIKNMEEIPIGSRRARYLGEIARASNLLSKAVERICERKRFPLVLGGDHSIAIGTISGVASFCRKHKRRLGLLWVDAHSDIHVPKTSPSGNIHGMPLAALFGLGPRELTAVGGDEPKLDPTRVALVGIRSLEDGERRHLHDLGIRVYAMSEIDRDGIHTVMSDALARVTDGTDCLHVSFDLDAVDPALAPGVGTPVKGGLDYREAHLIMELIAASKRMTSMEVVEVNPILDERNRSAVLAVELLESAFGKRIL